MRTLVDEQPFRVRHTPDPTVGITPLMGYTDHGTYLELIPFPYVHIVDVNYAATWQVKNFDIELYLKKGDTVILKNAGKDFTEESRRHFRELDYGDKVRLTNMVVNLACDTAERTGLSSRVYQINYRKPGATGTQRMRK